MPGVGTAPKQGATPTHAIDVGDVVLERYKVVEQIASGGHSVVFRGQDERLSRPVCIKVFSGLGGQSGVGRTSYEHFVQEAFALSRLTHPNTLRIYDFGHLGPKDEAGMPLQVCEFMNGGTLSMIVREQGKQSLGETVRIMSAMCSALAEAHGLGIVHRDIKPQNILFASVGATKLPKLADFGIAKWSAEAESSQDDENRAEDTAIVAGQKLAMYSPSWAAPEQLAGQPVSPATDIYSLACVTVYMLSAKAIFADEDVYAGYKKRRHVAELVKEALGPAGVPRSVVKLLGRALAFDPKQRVSSVEDLSAELAAALEPVTEEQPRPKPPPPPRAGAPRVSQVTPVTPTEPVERISAPAVEVPPEAAPPTAFVSPPPAVVQAWMMTAPAPSGMPYRLQLSDVPLQVGDRRVHFLMIAKSTGDLVGTQNMKVRVTLLPNPTGTRVVHLKGLTCFVSPLGGRPSPAVQLDKAGDVALVSPRGQEIGHVRVTTGAPGLGQTVFALGTEQVTIGFEDCADPILFDFGPGSDAYFVYTRGRTIPRPKGRG
jgi:serine/threonine-protein kinase